MIPALLLVGVGWQRRLPLPIPLFVLWPLVGLAVAVAALVRGVKRSSPVVPPVLAVLFQLSGLKLDVRAHDGPAFLVWFI